MELRQGIPSNLSTVIVVPTMLASLPEIRKQVERLEVHHLSNSDENLFYALLSDWRDNWMEHDASDEVLLAEAAAGITILNDRYRATDGNQRFFLLHRRRLWNAGEGKWIGWERKRGKLHELNRLLRGATDTSFLPIDGRAAALPDGIRYVITLDADTRLPIGAAKRLVGKMAHPLNRPRFDPRRGLVTHGHGILQPRMTRCGTGRTAIPLMGRWKLLDNLRRSLSAPAALLALLMAWLQPVPVAAIWTVFIIMTIALPPLIPAIAGIAPRRADASLRNYLRRQRRDFELGFLQCAFLITFLAHQAWLMVDAVGRTLFRIFIDRRHLLEWVTAAQTSDDSQFDQRNLMTQIAAVLIFFAIVVFGLYFLGQHNWPIAAPFAALWV